MQTTGQRQGLRRYLTQRLQPLLLMWPPARLSSARIDNLLVSRHSARPSHGSLGYRTGKGNANQARWAHPREFSSTPKSQTNLRYGCMSAVHASSAYTGALAPLVDHSRRRLHHGKNNCMSAWLEPHR